MSYLGIDQYSLERLGLIDDLKYLERERRIIILK